MHFVGLAFGENVWYNLDLYDQSREVEPWKAYNCDEGLEEFENLKNKIHEYGMESHYKEVDSLETDEQKLEFFADWEGYEYVNERGLYSTYNPYAKWDWYSHGGRFEGWLQTKDGLSVSSAEVGEIDWDKTLSPYCYIDESGEWYEQEEELWSTEQSEEKHKKWNQQFREYIDSLDEDTLVTVIDFHM